MKFSTSTDDIGSATTDRTSGTASCPEDGTAKEGLNTNVFVDEWKGTEGAWMDGVNGSHREIKSNKVRERNT